MGLGIPRFAPDGLTRTTYGGGTEKPVVALEAAESLVPGAWYSLGPSKSMKTDQIQKGRVPKILGRVFSGQKKTAGALEAAKSLVPGTWYLLVPGTR